MTQKVVVIAPTAAPKVVEPNQKALDELPLGTGTWRVRGTPGLSVRCQKQTKSFLLSRRVRGKLIQVVLGEMSLKQARIEAMKQWAALKPTPAGGRKTFQKAFDELMEQRELAPKTRHLYTYAFQHYLGDWKDRALAAIGDDRAGVRSLFHAIAKKHGAATANQVIRLISSVYNHARKVDKDLPESPTIAVDLATIKPRDWALDENELRAWWVGVSELNAVKKCWWQVALLTGARRGSVEALAWKDIDFEKRTILFRVTKRDRPYLVPAADRLMELLAEYKASDEVPPSDAGWLFPSNLTGDHLRHVRDDKRDVASAHHMRHTFRTTLAQLGVSSDQARNLMGHASSDVSSNYITAHFLIESLRPAVNLVAERYAKILGI